MSRKIIGVTTASPLPKPNLMQTDPKKGDYVKGKEEFLEQVRVDLTGYAKTEDIPQKPEDIGAQPAGNYLTAVPSGYATEEFVRNQIAEAELGGEEVDLSGYAQKSEIPTKVSQLQNDSGYLTKHQDISGKLDASALPTAINTALAQAKESGEFDGEDGEDGVSPTVTVTDIAGGHRVSITDAKGTQTFDVMDGESSSGGGSFEIPLIDCAALGLPEVTAQNMYMPNRYQTFTELSSNASNSLYSTLSGCNFVRLKFKFMGWDYNILCNVSMQPDGLAEAAGINCGGNIFGISLEKEPGELVFFATMCEIPTA